MSNGGEDRRVLPPKVRCKKRASAQVRARAVTVATPPLVCQAATECWRVHLGQVHRGAAVGRSSHAAWTSTSLSPKLVTVARNQHPLAKAAPGHMNLRHRLTKAVTQV